MLKEISLRHIMGEAMLVDFQAHLQHTRLFEEWLLQVDLDYLTIRY